MTEQNTGISSPAPSELLKSLQPQRRERVYDLLQEAGLDVSEWSKYKKPEAPAANPKYCYEWSFTEGDQLVVLNLWHASFQVDGETLACDLNMRAEAGEIERAQDEPWRSNRPKPVWAKRARAMDRALQVACRSDIPVRVIVCEGTMRDLAAGDEESSKVKLRSLDPAPWTLAAYDWGTGRARLRRIPEAAVEKARFASGSAELAREPKSPSLDAPTPEWDVDEASLREINALTLSQTEKIALVKTRINQSGYRQRLLARWDARCSVTGLPHPDVLIASHIVPWCECTTPEERWSPDNGLLLPPGLDKAFEVGLIGFDARGKIILSKRAERLDIQSGLGINRTLAIRNFHLYPGLISYLERHRLLHKNTLPIVTS